MIELFKRRLYVNWLVKEGKPMAYSIHYNPEKSFERMVKIKRFHNLAGKIIEDNKMDKDLENKIKLFLSGKKIKIKLSHFKFKDVYKELRKLETGETITYSEIASSTGRRIYEVILALTHNPMLILIPCHRVIKKNGDISGYTPLGKRFKELLLEKERFLNVNGKSQNNKV